VPFQRKTNGVVVVEPLSNPTAVQAVADEHETARSSPPEPGPLSGVLGIVWIVQLVPSQRSTSGLLMGGELKFCHLPTATHAVADVHATSWSGL
jgi:hypothetical protein